MPSSASAARRKKREHAIKTRELVLREDGQQYACVTKMLGNGRVEATCVDGVERLCKIRGSMRKREWVRVGDVVLVCLRDFQDAKADIVHKYTDAEVHRLRRLGEEVVLPSAAAAAADEDPVADAVEFEEEEAVDWAAI